MICEERKSKMQVFVVSEMQLNHPATYCKSGKYKCEDRKSKSFNFVTFQTIIFKR